MGDSWQTIQNESQVSLSWYTSSILFLVRFLGWLIVPIVAGIIFDEAQKELETDAWRIKHETEKRVENAQKVIKQSAIDTFGSEEAEVVMSKIKKDFQELKEKFPV